MESSPNDTLDLKGALQVDTAIAALRAIDVNPSAEKSLTTIRNIQQVLVKAFPDAPERINLHFEGGSTAAMRADLLIGLEMLTSSADTPEQKIAAKALLEVMTR